MPVQLAVRRPVPPRLPELRGRERRRHAAQLAPRPAHSRDVRRRLKRLGTRRREATDTGIRPVWAV